MDVKQQICQILDIDTSYEKHFSVLEQEGDVALIQYIEGGDLSDPITRTLRGVVVDLKNNATLCTTSVYSVQSDADKFTVVDDTIHLNTEFGPRQLPLKNCQLSPHYSGVKLTFLRHGGITYCITHKNLFARGRVIRDYNERGDLRKAPARFGHLQSFVSMMEDVVGDLDEFMKKLYPEGCDYSPFIYSFYVAHPALRFSTMLKAETFIIFFGSFPMWSQDNATSPYDWDNDPTDPRPKVGTPHLKPTVFDGPSAFPYHEDQPGGFIMIPGRTTLSIPEADNVLRYGVPNPDAETKTFFDNKYKNGADVRTIPGESVIIVYTPDNVDDVPEHFHVRSTASRYRDTVHADESNQYLAFLQLIDHAFRPMRLPENRDRLRSHVAPVKLPSRDSVKEVLTRGDDIVFANTFTDAELSRLNLNDTIIMVSNAFLVASNPHNQLMTFRFYDRYLSDVAELTKWIVREQNAHGYPKTHDNESLSDKDRFVYDKQIKRIIAHAKERLKTDYPKLSFNGQGKRRKTQQEVMDTIIIPNLVQAQHGDNFFRMVRLMSRVTGYDSKRISDPSAPVASRRSFPSLPSSSARSPSIPAPSSSSRPNWSMTSSSTSSYVPSSPEPSGSDLDDFILGLSV